MNLVSQTEAVTMCGFRGIWKAQLAALEKSGLKPVISKPYGKRTLAYYDGDQVGALAAKINPPKPTPVTVTAPAEEHNVGKVLETIEACRKHTSLVGEGVARLVTKSDKLESDVRRLQLSIDRLLKAANLPTVTN